MEKEPNIKFIEFREADGTIELIRISRIYRFTVDPEERVIDLRDEGDEVLYQATFINEEETHAAYDKITNALGCSILNLRVE